MTTRPLRFLLLWLVAPLLAVASASPVSAGTGPSGSDGPMAALETAIVDTVRTRVAPGGDAHIVVSDVRPADPGLWRSATAVESVRLPEGARALGRVTLLASVRSDAGTEEVWIAATVELRAPIVVVARPVPRGALLRAEDLTMAVHPVTERTVASFGHALGRVLRRGLRAGDIVRPDLLELPTAIRRGDRVAALVSGRGYRLETAAEALAKGAVGDAIPVRISLTSKVVTGVVTSPRTVEVRP